MNEAVKELGEWAAKELPGSRCDTAYLKRFLIGCKMRQDVARSKMKNCHKLRENNPQWYRERDPSLPHIKHLLQLGVFLPLPRKDAHGRTIIVVRATINDPATHPMMDVFKVGLMVLDSLMEEDMDIVEHGVVVIIDIAQVTIYHVPQLTPQLLHKAVHSWQDCYPIRIKGIHFINCPWYASTILGLLKSFMRSKLKQRVHMYGKDLRELPQHISHELLPKEYGGQQGSIQDVVRYWHNFTQSKREWFLAQFP